MTRRDHPLYRQVCYGLDRAVARQEGDTAAGDRCRQRAEALQAAGRPLDALREFHQAKINWFHGDTLYGTLRAMACITDIYAGLGMYLAGKKYALAMASLALGSPDAASATDSGKTTCRTPIPSTASWPKTASRGTRAADGAVRCSGRKRSGGCQSGDDEGQPYWLEHPVHGPQVDVIVLPLGRD
jgi:hypothetical protein